MQENPAEGQGRDSPDAKGWGGRLFDPVPFTFFVTNGWKMV
jgi:hypothetical protein